MEIAKRCSRKAASHRWSERENFGDFIDDSVSDIMEAYYSINEFDRPHNEDEFVEFCFVVARKSLGRERNKQRREFTISEINQTVTTHYASSKYSYDGQREIDMVDTIIRRWRGVSPPDQEMLLYIQDILRAVKLAPDDVQRAIFSLADYGSIIEYAKDHQINLFDAMSAIKRSREIISRIAGDIQDEKKFS